MEYSITAEEMQDIMEKLVNEWECTHYEPDDTLYIRLVLGDQEAEFEFPHD